MSHLYKPNYNEWTSKNRLKVSDYTTVFFNTFQYGIETDIWDQELTNGGPQLTTQIRIILTWRLRRTLVLKLLDKLEM